MKKSLGSKEPKIREVTNGVAFFGEDDRQPFLVEGGVFFNGVGQGEQEHRLADATRSEDEEVLGSVSGLAFANARERFVELMTAGDELLQEGFGRKVARVVDT